MDNIYEKYGFTKYEDWPLELSLKKAKEELNEHEETREEEIRRFRELVLAKSSIEIRILDDEYLLRFLRVRKFDHQRALLLLENHEKFKKKHEKMFRNLKLELWEKKIKKAKTSSFLRFRNRNGCPILVFFVERWDPAIDTAEDAFTALVMYLEAALQEEVNQINGLICIFDIKGVAMHHIKALGPYWLKFLANLTNNTFPLRFKEIIIVNANFVLNIIMKIIWPFFSEKMKKRIHFDTANLDKLYETVPQELLPEELGGFAGPFDVTWWIEKMKNMKPI